MIDPLKHIVIIDGEDKTSAIRSISIAPNGTFAVKFKNSTNWYHYNTARLFWSTNAIQFELEGARCFLRGRIKDTVCAAAKFLYRNKTYWHVKYNTGKWGYYADGEFIVIESCFKDSRARRIFDYLATIAESDPFGADPTIEDSVGLLGKLYMKVAFVPNDGALALYLNPSNSILKRNAGRLIYPFGCNASQKKAVQNAIGNQLSVIQGPPGTGKTQTILNIIANIVMRGETVLVSSSNNSAIANVLEKLRESNLSFIAAQLGRKENKERFIENQPLVPDELSNWKCKGSSIKKELNSLLSQMDIVYAYQSQLEKLRGEKRDAELEWQHFKMENEFRGDEHFFSRFVKSDKILRLWMEYEIFGEACQSTETRMRRLIFERMKWKWRNFIYGHILDLKFTLDGSNVPTIIKKLQSLYYRSKIGELQAEISKAESFLNRVDAKDLHIKLKSLSMSLFNGHLYEKYYGKERYIFDNVKDVKINAEAFKEQFPVVLSTTFSSVVCLPEDSKFDYILVDEASQVSIETGALALLCAKSAVIVGDSMQLPNVVSEDSKKRQAEIKERFDIPDAYECSSKSLLQSVIEVRPDAPQVMLLEHYRCHPKIINFCNQKFYGGNLIIMTEDAEEEYPMFAVKTTIGNHSRLHYNQRQIDVIKYEVLPKMTNSHDIGIIAPYNAQVDQISRQLPDIETATIHKFQGREKDYIILSTVDDQMSEFVNNYNLINVAVSRAKKCFCLVVTGNNQNKPGVVSELLDYIEYNNFTVTQSKVRSIFDYLYRQYTSQRMELVSRLAKVSEYDSENLTFALICKVLHEDRNLSHLDVLCHVPLRDIISDSLLMTNEELQYASNYSTHVDFLIVNRVSRKPVLVIETDGFLYHHVETIQHERDEMKDSILEKYKLPLLRLSTIDSQEHLRIKSTLFQILGISA